MKKAISLILALVLCFCLCSCGNDSKNRIQNAEDLIDELSRTMFVYDDLYLTEHAELHHNSWTTAYEKAINAYNALSTEEKKEVYNAYYFDNYESVSIEIYEEILIEQEIALYCKDAAVEKLKNALINKSSYEEYDWTLDHCFYHTDDNTFWVKLKIEYSATNKLGGRIDDTEYADCKGTYQDGKIVITKLTF